MVLSPSIGRCGQDVINDVYLIAMVIFLSNYISHFLIFTKVKVKRKHRFCRAALYLVNDLDLRKTFRLLWSLNYCLSNKIIRTNNYLYGQSCRVN